MAITRKNVLLGFAGLFGLTAASIWLYRKKVKSLPKNQIFIVPIEAEKYTVQHQDAIERFQQISDIDYSLYLNLIDGDSYQGVVFVQFTYTQNPNSQYIPYLDFAGSTVASLLINGQETQLSNPPHVLKLPNLKPGKNQVQVDFTTKYRKDGHGLHRFVDPQDNETYIYTQFEPSDARLCFPCFDQPDMKGTMQLNVLAKEHWKVISNTFEDKNLGCKQSQCLCEKFLRDRKDKVKCVRFQQTQKISSYLYAVCAGPFDEFRYDQNDINLPLGVLCRKSITPYINKEELINWTVQCIKWYEHFFGQKFPFPKLDHVFAPEFNFLAMENVGCITYKDNLITKEEQSKQQKLRYCSVVLHEISHMWFGNLTTMKWWDDLWLNESFADFICNYCLFQVFGTEFPQLWQYFNTRKQWGIDTDVKPTTHPIRVQVINTEQAITNVDGITYGKGSAVLKQLLFRIGEKAFSDGCKIYFEKFKFSNATFDDFMVCMSEACQNNQVNINLSQWAEEWVKKAGINELQISWQEDANKAVAEVRIFQIPQNLNHPTLRSHQIIVEAYDEKNQIKVSKVIQVLNQEVTIINDFNGLQNVQFFMLDSGDQDYCKIILSDKDLEYLKLNLSKIPDALNRIKLWRSLHSMIENDRLSGVQFVEFVIQNIIKETDFQVASIVLGMCNSTLLNNIHDLQTELLLTHQVFEITKELLGLANEKSEKLDLSQQVISFMKNKEDIELYGLPWLKEGVKDPKLANLDLGQEKRWQILMRAATLLSREQLQPYLDQESQKDQSSTAKNSKLYCDAAFGEEANKQKLWEKITTDCKVFSNEEVIYIFQGWNQRHQDQIIKKYIQSYFQTLDTKCNEFPYEYLRKMVMFLFPECYGIDEQCLMYLEELLKKLTEKQFGLKRFLLERQFAFRARIKTRSSSQKYVEKKSS